MARLALGLALVALGAGLALTGCEEDSTTEPVPVTGQIQGRISALGLPVDARITANRVRDADGQLCPCSRLEAQTDSSGSYQLSVPAGRYTLRIAVRLPSSSYAGLLAHGTLSQTDADTLAVGAGGSPVRADLRLGVARIELLVPAALNGARVLAELAAQDPGASLLLTSYTEPSEGFAAFYFPAVPSGSYRMRLNLGTLSRFWLPGSYSQSEGNLLDVGIEAESVYHNELASLATLRGLISGSWQELNLSPPILSLFGEDSTRIAVTFADYDGTFEIITLAPIQARLQVRIEEVTRWEGGSSYEEATIYTLDPNGDTALEITDSAIAADLRQSTYSSYGEPAILYDTEGRVVGQSWLRRDSGMLFISNLTPGSYRLRIPGGPTWIEHYYNLAETLDQATPIVVPSEGQTVWVYPELMAGAKISGIVLGPGGDPAPGAEVFLSRGDVFGTYMGRNAYTRESGAFELIAIGDGSYKVGASLRPVGLIWYPGTAFWDSAGVITVANHEDLTGLVIRAPQ